MVLEQHYRLSRSNSEEAPNSVRVLVAGDAAVGKTSLVEMICGGGCGTGQRPDGSAAPQQGEWTCGCALSLTRESVEVGFKSVDLEVELWEVGGTKMYSYARPVFYDGLDAVLLVYDVSNMKSYDSLVVWLFELCTSAWPPSLRYWDTGGGSGGVHDVDLESGGRWVMQEDILGGRIPVLFVANKCDLRTTDATRTEGRAGDLMPALQHVRRPCLPDRQPLLDRFFGGEPGPAVCRSDADHRLMEQLCDFVAQGRHTTASSRADAQSFDFPFWRDFVRQAFESKDWNSEG